MFTGLIADLGRVRSYEGDESGARIVIDTALAGELHEGDSIAVGGVCLTATAVTADGFDRRGDARDARALGARRTA